ncbi:restriction endonuclease subunit S [Halomonas sp. HAL1]|uniref:restriction endonuclease subunit S n=1 Tax=Halomonas sp. HAL1 TaxID=550984 RepID=UPI00022D2D1A|nr:restriction endonuclease subunit S [Halomonas sp. HAL1]EHA14572.1 type I restriction-modification system S subunit [Halomonas sp. HAL1]WKV93766.1 restriction endonuclease subunit S [Halomonas sp. HAL1]
MSYFARSDELPAWVGALPGGWKSDWLKWSVRLSTERPTDEEQVHLPYISNEDIASWTGELLNDQPLPAESDGRKFQVDDVLLNKLRPYLAKVYHAGFNGVSSGELLCLRPSDIVLPRFLFYVLVSKGFIDSIDAETFGSKMPRADWEIVGHQPLPLPSFETQQRIAQFLDKKTAQIGGLIEKKRTLLNQLAEKRQALITRAVTKGLNPDVPMMPSGIDWLGDIPAHWEVKRLKFVTSAPLSYGANATAEFDEPAWPRFVRITDVDKLGRLRDETYRSLPPEVAKGYLLQPNDILLARSGATVGKSFIYKESWGVACYAGYLIRARISKKYDARFFYWFLNSKHYWEWVQSTFIQSTIQNISADRYGNLQIPLPVNKIEQERIVNFIENTCAELDGHFEKVMFSVERLEEYRSALITEAVTGKIGGLQ